MILFTKIRHSIAALGLVLLISGSARADLVKLVDVSVDYFPGRQYAIGFDLDSDLNLKRVYFDNDGNRTFYSLDDLKDYNSVFRVAGFNFVKMKIASMDSPTSGTLELQILQNYVRGFRKSLYFKAKLNSSSGHYEIIDLRTGKLIHSASALTRYAGPVPIGVYDIETE